MKLEFLRALMRKHHIIAIQEVHGNMASKHSAHMLTQYFSGSVLFVRILIWQLKFKIIHRRRRWSVLMSESALPAGVHALFELCSTTLRTLYDAAHLVSEASCTRQSSLSCSA